MKSSFPVLSKPQVKFTSTPSTSTSSRDKQQMFNYFKYRTTTYIPLYMMNLKNEAFFAECGNYHSLKWYRDSTRVFVYSPIAGFKNAEDILMDR